MPSTDPMSVVDLVQHADGRLSVAWTAEPGAAPRPIDAATEEAVRKLLDAVHDAERRAQSSGAPEAVTAPRLALGERLFALLDGPERALARRIDAARGEGRPMRLVVRLRVEAPKDVAAHPAALWRWELLADGHGFVALRDEGVMVGVQVGEAVPRAETPRTQGRLRILFMASSAQGVKPVLDYEHEEETLADALSGFVSRGKVLLRVAEEGNLERLCERLQNERYDVVHLSGHGELTDKGPRLIMEDAGGGRVDVSAEDLLKVLRRAKQMPFLVVIASCWSTGGRPDVPSLAAQLVAGGVPCVIGWVRPVQDVVATEAARDLYERVCVGRSPLDAAAHTRKHLHTRERGQERATHAWATMQLLSRHCPGPSVELGGEEASAEVALPGEMYRMLGSRMRVMERGFVGRRRELQRLIRMLREGKDDGRAVAGAVIAGMKGQGKSSLVGRAIDRHRDDIEVAPGLVVLHGALRESEVIEAFRACAMAWGDTAAERVIDDVAQPVLKRVERLLRGPWKTRRLVIVLDDFEHNLDVPATGLAQLKPEAAALLEAVVPACQMGRPKVLVTSTAHFAEPTKLAGALVPINLGALEPASVRKLWWRGQEGKELEHMLPTQWETLADRLGRNARVLDWARQLMGGKTPREVEKVLARAGMAMGDWKGRAPDEAEQAGLAAVFLEQLAYEAAQESVGDGAMTFVQRARVYEVPVPEDAFAGLTEGTGVDLAVHVPALANLGLLEMGSDEDGGRVYRVSPLVEREFRAEGAERWHGVAARWFRRVAVVKGGLRADRVQMAWMHALAARDQEVADWGAERLWPWTLRRGAYGENAALAQIHVARFPESVEGAHWEGYAIYKTSGPAAAREKMLRAETLAMYEQVSIRRRRAVIGSTAQVLAACGDLIGAAERLKRVVEEEEKETPRGTLFLAMWQHELAGVLRTQGDLRGARDYLERSLTIKRDVFGTEKHREVGASLHALALVLQEQGDLAGARTHMERSYEILRDELGTEEHPEMTASLHCLAGLLLEEGKVNLAILTWRRVLELEARVFGTLDQYHSAETEFALGRALALSRPEEAVPLLHHAMQVFRTQVPGHPFLPQLEALFHPTSPSDPRVLTKVALQARASKTPPPPAFTEGLEALRSAGAPHDAVAAQLDAIAHGAALPPIPDALPEPVRAFLAQVHDAARTLPAP